MPILTPNERKARQADRYRAEGLRQVSFWIPEGKLIEVRAYVRSLPRASEPVDPRQVSLPFGDECARSTGLAADTPPDAPQHVASKSEGEY